MGRKKGSTQWPGWRRGSSASQPASPLQGLEGSDAGEEEWWGERLMKGRHLHVFPGIGRDLSGTQVPAVSLPCWSGGSGHGSWSLGVFRCLALKEEDRG